MEKLTCKVNGEWEMTSRTQAARHDTCSNCGYEFGVSRRNYFPFIIEFPSDIPNYCPNCGAKVEKQE